MVRGALLGALQINHVHHPSAPSKFIFATRKLKSYPPADLYQTAVLFAGRHHSRYDGPSFEFVVQHMVSAGSLRLLPTFDSIVNTSRVIAWLPRGFSAPR